MKLLLKDLYKHRVQKLVINSIEQALYQVIAVVDGVEHVVWKTDKKVLLTRNLMEFRVMFEHFPAEEIVLRHESAYDEMIGLDTVPNNNRLEVPLNNKPYSIVH